MAYLIRTKSSFLRLLRPNVLRRSLTSHPRENPEEYTNEPEYPPLIDTSYEARKLRKKQAEHEEFKQVGTVEEKLFKVNLPRYYGFKSLMLNEEWIPYNALGFVQYSTRTDFKEEEKLPAFYAPLEEPSKKIAESLKSEVEDIIGFEYSEQARQRSFEEPDDQERFLASNVVQQLNRLILARLSPDFSHLNDAEVDTDPRHEAFWYVGGIDPPKSIVRMNEGKEWRKKYAKDPVDRYLQYVGTPYLTVRHQEPLKPLTEVAVDQQDAALEEVQIPDFKLDPRTLGYKHEYRHGTTVPGFWAGSSQEFGLLSYQSREHFGLRPSEYGPEDFQEALHAQGIQSSFAWLFGQACYQGFSTFTELTYPLATQTVVTNGRDFSFYAYQMNTVLLHSEFARTNPRYNQCWGTKEAQLFQEVDESGKVVGFNDEVLKNLVSFYLNAPEARQHEMKPYLDASCPRLSDIEDQARRVFMETKYKHIFANRPRYRRIPETYLWEKIYKIDFNTRYFDKKTRPHDTGVNPFKRRLDDHTATYIPRALRPGGYGNRRKKCKDKWEKTYYPLGAKGKTPNVPNYPFVPYSN